MAALAVVGSALKKVATSLAGAGKGALKMGAQGVEKLSKGARTARVSLSQGRKIAGQKVSNSAPVKAAKSAYNATKEVAEDSRQKAREISEKDGHSNLYAQTYKMTYALMMLLMNMLAKLFGGAKPAQAGVSATPGTLAGLNGTMDKKSVMNAGLKQAISKKMEPKMLPGPKTTPGIAGPKQNQTQKIEGPKATKPKQIAAPKMGGK